MNEKNEDFFAYNPHYNNYYTQFNGVLSFVSSSTKINPLEMTNEQMAYDKPVYLAIMARRHQLQPILDNPHLFDPAFVQAVEQLAIQYAELRIEPTK